MMLNGSSKSARSSCWWRWRFQPVLGILGHLGIDYSFEDPSGRDGEFLLRHLDYGLPGDPAVKGYRQCIARYSGMVALNGEGWPPLRTPKGRVYVASEFRPAPRAVGEYLAMRMPNFWGRCGAYRTLGPNSNSGLRAALRACEDATGYRFDGPPPRMRIGAHGWSWPLRLAPNIGPYPGYFEDETRLRWRTESLAREFVGPA